MFVETVILFEMTFICIVIGYMGKHLEELRNLQAESLKIQDAWKEAESLKIQDSNQ